MYLTFLIRGEISLVVNINQKYLNQMLATSKNPNRNTSILKAPSGSFRFWVEIDGIFVGGFTEVSGLRSETEVEEYREGGVNNFVHHFPKITKYPTITLKRGVTTSSELYNWYKDVAAGKFIRKNGAVVLLNQTGDEIWRWNFFNSYPVKWIGPELKSTRAEIAVETLELVHNGLKGIAKK